MVVFTEKEQLDEVSIRIISNPEDKLPFKVTIKCPDRGRLDHAYLMKLGAEADEIGAFVITQNPPETIDDLVGYTEGYQDGIKNLTNEQLLALVSWVSRRNSLISSYTNWQVLQYENAVNRNSLFIDFTFDE
jgi:hypothetical protein